MENTTACRTCSHPATAGAAHCPRHTPSRETQWIARLPEIGTPLVRSQELDARAADLAEEEARALAGFRARRAQIEADRRANRIAIRKLYSHDECVEALRCAGGAA